MGTATFGTPISWDDGLIGKCGVYSESTNQYINSDVTRGSGNLSGFMILNMTASTNYQVLFSDYSMPSGGNANGGGVFYNTSTYDLRYNIYNSDASDVQGASITINLVNKWTFIGFSLDSTAKKSSIFCDGQYSVSSALTGTLGSCANPAQFFRHPNTSASRPLKGKVSHLYLGAHTLSQSELMIIYQSLKGTYRF
jgi:hypothetical protein